MRSEEQAAGILIAKALPGVRVHYQEEQANGECDFLIGPESNPAPMEVTRATSGDYRALHRAILGRDGNANSVQRPEGSVAWFVELSHDADIARVRRDIHRYLVNLETQGTTEFTVASAAEDASAILEIWRDLRVAGGFRLDPPSQSIVVLGVPSDSARLHPEQVLEAVEREARKEDNVRKLSRPGMANGHLFVILDFFAYPAVEAMRVGPLPQAFPDVADVISDVWVAREPSAGTSYMLWHASRASGWTDFGAHDIAQRGAV